MLMETICSVKNALLYTLTYADSVSTSKGDKAEPNTTYNFGNDQGGSGTGQAKVVRTIQHRETVRSRILQMVEVAQ